MTPQERAENPLQKQEGGSHYKNCRIQPVEYIHANGMGYIEGAVIKYVTRYKQKNGAEDIRKAIHFLELLLQLEYEDARETAGAAFTPVQEEVCGWTYHGNCVFSTECDQELVYEGPVPEVCPACGRKKAIVELPSPPIDTAAEQPSFPFTFPPALKWMGKSETEYDEKLIEEVDEVIKAKDSRERMMELLDVLHVVETAVRTLAEKTGLDPAAAIVEVIRKNSARNYYQG